jgi:hypothetical protein
MKTARLGYDTECGWPAEGFPTAKILGCSTAGEIAGTEIVDHGLAVAVSSFAKTRLSLATARVPAIAASADAGEAIARALSSPDLRAIFVLSDGLSVNGSARAA